jgi:hypothetical protein
LEASKFQQFNTVGDTIPEIGKNIFKFNIRKNTAVEQGQSNEEGQSNKAIIKD